MSINLDLPVPQSTPRGVARLVSVLFSRNSRSAQLFHKWIPSFVQFYIYTEEKCNQFIIETKNVRVSHSLSLSKQNTHTDPIIKSYQCVFADY